MIFTENNMDPTPFLKVAYREFGQWSNKKTITGGKMYLLTIHDLLEEIIFELFVKMAQFNEGVDQYPGGIDAYVVARQAILKEILAQSMNPKKLVLRVKEEAEELGEQWVNEVEKRNLTLLEKEYLQ
jgi:hypothetical protein